MSTQQQEITKEITLFGNCAETYPIPLQHKGIMSATYDDRLSGQTWRRVADPCLN